MHSQNAHINVYIVFSDTKSSKSFLHTLNIIRKLKHKFIKSLYYFFYLYDKTILLSELKKLKKLNLKIKY